MSELLPFGDIAEMHKRLSERSPFFAQMSQDQFAQLGNEWTGTQAFSRGVDDNIVKQASRAVDFALGPSAEVSGELASAIGQAVLPKYEPQFRSFGEALPRDLITMALLGGGPLGIASAAGLAGSRAYEETGSKAAGLVGAGATAVLPKFARKGGEVAASGLRRLVYGAETVGAEKLALRAPQLPGFGFLERTIEAAGRNVGVLINQELATQASSVAMGQGLYPITPQHVAELAGPQAAFGIVDLLTATFTPKIGFRSLTAFKADQARKASIERQFSEQALPPKINAQKPPVIPVTPEKYEQVDLPLFEAAQVSQRWHQAQRRAETAVKVNTSDVISVGERKALDSDYVAQMVQSGTLAEQVDGSLRVLKKVSVSGDDLVGEALRLFEGKIVTPIVKVSSAERMQTARSEEAFRRQFAPLPEAEGAERAKVTPSTTPRGAEPGVREQLQLPGMAAGAPAETVAKQRGGAPQPAAVPPLITHATGAPAIVVTPETRQQLLQAKPGTEQIDMRMVDAAIIQQIKPLVDEAVLRRLQMPLDPNVPLDVKLVRLQEISKTLESALKEALTLRGVDGKVLETHPAAQSYFAEYQQAMTRLHERFGLEPTPELLNEAYNATMAHVAKVTQSLQALAADTARLLPPVIHDVGTFQRLVQLEEVPHGPAVLSALAGVLGDKVVYRGQRATDVGMISDPAYYAIIDKASKLADATQMQRALEALWAKEPLARERYYGVHALARAQERFQVERAAAERFIRRLTEAEPLDAGMQELLNLRYLRDLAEQANVEVHDLSLVSLGEWLTPDAGQLAKREFAVGWFTKTFGRAMSFAEWQAEGDLRLVRRGNVKERMFVPAEELAKRYQGKGRYSGAAQQKLQEERYNKTLELLRSGKLEIRYDRGGFEVGEPADKAAVLKHVGYSVGETVTSLDNNWKAFRTGVIADVVGRLNAKFDRALAGFEGTVQSAERISSAGEIPGTLQRGNTLAASALTLADSPPQLAVIAGAKQWFRDHFQKRGLVDDTVEMYSTILAKVAAAYPELGFTRVATIHDFQRAGVTLAIRSPFDAIIRQVVGLSTEQFGILDPRVAAADVIHTLGHELLHSHFNAPTAKTKPWLSQMALYADSLQAYERMGMLHDVQLLVVPEKVLATEPALASTLALRLDIASKNPTEFLADLAGYYTMGYVNPDKVTTVTKINNRLLFSDAHTQQFLKGYFLSLNDLAEGLHRYYQVNSPTLAEPFGKIMQSLRKVLVPMKEIENAVAVLRRLEEAEPANYMSLLSKGYQSETFSVSGALRAMGVDIDEAKIGSVNSALRKATTQLGMVDDAEVTKAFGVHVPTVLGTFMESHQLAQMYAPLRGPIDLVRSYRPMLNDFVDTILRPIMRKTSVLKRQVLDVEGSGFKYVAQHENTREAFTRIVLKEQLQGRSFSETEMRAEMQGLSPTAQQKVIDFRTGVREVMTNLRETMIKNLWQSAQFVAAQKLMVRSKTLRADQARAIGEQLSSVSWAALHGDVAATQRLLALQTTPEMIESAALVRALHQPVMEFEKRTAGNVWFMSEMRTGRFYVGYNNPNATIAREKSGLQAFETKEQAVAWAKREAERTGVPVDKFRFWDRWSRAAAEKGLSPDFIKTLQEIERGAQLHKVMELDLPKELAEKMLSYHPMETALREITEGGTEKYLMQRKLRAGREELDMVGNFLPHVRGVANSLAKRWVRGEMGVALMDPELRANSELHAKALQHLNNVVSPPTGELSFAKRMVFGYMLAYSPSSIAINGFDTFISLAPQLTQDTGSVLAGYRYAGLAAKDLIGQALHGKTGNAALDKAIARALKEQYIGFGVIQETYDAETQTALNLRSLHAGVGDAVQLGKRALDTYSMYGRIFYGNLTKLNSYVAFMAAFRAATEHGVLVNNKVTKLGPEAAYSYAKHTTDSTQHGGGVAARPIGMFSNLGKTHGAVGLAYSLSTYTVGTISMMARLGLQSIQKLPGAERSAARKAFGQMMFTQTALAGVIGLPGFAAVLATLNKFFPELEATKAVEDGFAALAGDDDELGELVADVAMRGVVNKGLGIDISSRLSLANMLGVSAYEGISPEAFFGPVGSMFGNMLKAVQYGAAGDTGAAVEQLVPTPYKNLVHSYRNEGVLRDKSGRLLVTPTEAESAAFVLGFKPTRLTKLRDKQRLIEQHDNVVRLENQQFNREVAKLVMAGDIASAKQRLIAREQETDGRYLAARGAMDIAEEVIDRTAPFDLTRGGAKLASAERRRLASPLDQPVWSEMQRLVTKKTLATQLGVPGVGWSRTELTRAQLMDQLMQSNPLLGRAEAMQMVNVMLGQRVPQLY